MLQRLPRPVREPIRDSLRYIDAWIRWRLSIIRDDGVVPFSEGRFAVTSDRAALVARTFYEGGQLSELIGGHLELEPPANGNRAVDIGCGYGRLTPYICDAPHINSVHGIEPNDRARERAAELYPFITFADGVAHDIPYPDHHFALAVAWTVLQHIPENRIEQTAEEIARVVAPGGYLISCDKTAGATSPVVYPRPIRHYEALFDGFECVDSRERSLEPKTDHHGENSVMVFRRRE